MLVTQAAVKHLGEGASVINISSSSTTRYPPGTVVYTGTKGAVEAITGVLAVELGARRIRVNTISPGWGETEGTADFLNADHRAAMLAETPLGRSGQPDDIGDVAVFLASNDSRWLTGERLSASGGMRSAARWKASARRRRSSRAAGGEYQRGSGRRTRSGRASG